MKHETMRPILLFVALLLALCPALSGNSEALGNTQEDYCWEEVWEKGPSGSSVCYPVLIATENPAAQAMAAKINGTIQENAHIPAYLQLLPAIQEGGTGLFMDYDMSCPYTWADETDEKLVCSPYVSILFSARGKMLTGRPSQVYYPMTLNIKTGEPVAFEELFTDPDGAKAFIEAYLEEEAEPILSTYLENNQLFPVPYDRFFLDGCGNLILCYENSQLSFLSGDSGAVAFRYSELWDWLDTSPEGIPMAVLTSPEQYAERPAPIAEQMDEFCMGAHPLYGFGMEGELGMSVEVLTDLYPQAADSEYYPDGACFEVETAVLRGTLILTDEAEERVTGILSNRADYFGIFTGKTALKDAEALMEREPSARLSVDETFAEMYRVCPGTMDVYSMDGYLFTLYADVNGVVQYIGMDLQ